MIFISCSCPIFIPIFRSSHNSYLYLSFSIFFIPIHLIVHFVVFIVHSNILINQFQVPSLLGFRLWSSIRLSNFHQRNQVQLIPIHAYNIKLESYNINNTKSMSQGPLAFRLYPFNSQRIFPPTLTTHTSSIHVQDNKSNIYTTQINQKFHHQSHKVSATMHMS